MSRSCKRCGGNGLIKVRYRQEDGYDVAVCDCPAGQWYRQKGMLPLWLDEHQATPQEVGRYEEFFPDDAAKSPVR